MEERLKTRLKHIMETRPHSIECMVAHEAMAFGEGPTVFFLEILTNGCPCGLESLLNDRIPAHGFHNDSYSESMEPSDMDTETTLMEANTIASLSSETFERIAREMYFRMAFETKSISDCFSPVAV